MKIAIISDIHDNLINLEKCLKTCQEEKVEKIICCGDVGNFETLKYISSNFSGEIFLVEGNAETYHEKDVSKLANINYQGLIGYANLNKKNIGFCHKSIDIPKVKENSESKLDFIFYGHSHKPWLETVAGTALINPGNIANIYYQATFALLDLETKNLELKIIK